MKKAVFVLLAVILAATRPAMSTPITGNVAIAGASTYTLSGIHFNGPAFVLIGTGDFLPDMGTSFPIHNFNYASAPGVVLFDTGSGISMDLLTFNVVQNSANFLNALGTADMLKAGFDTTAYNFTLTATRPDGVSSFTMTAVPAVPEPASLILVGSGLALGAVCVCCLRRKRLDSAPRLVV
jgi:hypothetical protein